MEIENVLELKIVKMNDEYSAVAITKQEDNFIKRGEFEFIASNGFVIISELFPDYQEDLKTLNIKGLQKIEDNKTMLIPNEYIPDLERAVKELNEKYGIKKNWRAKKHGKYYFVNFYTLDVLYDFEKNTIFSKMLYPTGNYFRTEEQAEEFARRIKKVIKEYHEEIGE